VKRILLALTLVAATAAALPAQKVVKRDRYKMAREELAEYALQNLSEVIPKARPHFLMFQGGGTQGIGEATMSGVAPRLLVYVNNQSHGDSTVLRFFRADEIREIRYYKPAEAMTRLGADNAYVIQLIPLRQVK
jgi:hypothetical protein